VSKQASKRASTGLGGDGVVLERMDRCAADELEMIR
jgi:hypothetical protein